LKVFYPVGRKFKLLEKLSNFRHFFVYYATAQKRNGHACTPPTETAAFPLAPVTDSKRYLRVTMEIIIFLKNTKPYILSSYIHELIKLNLRFL
jgi:hypothetical protein